MPSEDAVEIDWSDWRLEGTGEAQREALLVLEADGPVTAQALGDRLGVSTTRARQILTRLHERGVARTCGYDLSRGQTPRQQWSSDL